MSGSSKILTVSYGTFSCTLEGFDDPFGTMRSIAEYFRDLAADDRYFGAEPPTPDVEMLQSLAEREVKRRVTARMGEGSVALQVADRAEPAPERPAREAEFLIDDEPEDILAFDGDEPEDSAEHRSETVAEKLSRIRAVVSRTVELDEADEDDNDDAAARPARSRALTETLDSIAADIAEDDAGDDDAQAADADPDAAPGPRDPEPAAAVHAAPDIADAAPLPEVAPDGAETQAQVSIEADQPEADDFGDEDFEDDDWPAAGDDAKAVSAAAPDADHAAEDAADPQPADAGDDRLERLAALAAEVSEPREDAAVAESDDDEDADDDAARPEAEASADPFADEDDDEDALDLVMQDDFLDEEPRAREAAPEPAIAAAEFDAPEDDAGDGAGEDALRPAAVARNDEADAEDDAFDAFATDDADDADEVDAAADGDDDDDDDASPAGDDARTTSSINRIMAVLSEDEDEDDEPGLSPPVAPASRRPTTQLGPIENDSGRLMAETDEKLADDDSVRRRRVISQMRAAVAATRADRILSHFGSRPKSSAESEYGYRNDLNRMMTSTRPRSATDRSSTPLVLVSEQRVDQAADRGEPDEKVVDFATFASDMGAEDLPELLEAAAAYAAFVEGQPFFSRPDIMRRVAGADPDVTLSREAGLRSFGQLLREGKIKKLQRGQFTIAEDTRFNPAHRIAGE